MSILQTAAAALAGCNMHFCIYAGLGMALLVRAAFALAARRYEEAREHGILGLTHIALGLT